MPKIDREILLGHIKETAAAIIDDTDDTLFNRYVTLIRSVHPYSLRNKLLIAWQAPDSRLVASKTAFDTIAKEQGHDGVKFGKPPKTWKQHIIFRKGSQHIGILRREIYKRKVEDPETGDVDEVSGTWYPTAQVWAAEDIVYCDTKEPFEVPDFVHEVDDVGAYEKLLTLAATEGIVVEHTNVAAGNSMTRGTSSGGTIRLQAGDPPGKLLPVLVHELAHEFMHHNGDERPPKDMVEAEAEATCAVVLRWLGQDTRAQSGYLRQWGATPDMVLASMGRIDKCARRITEVL